METETHPTTNTAIQLFEHIHDCMSWLFPTRPVAQTRILASIVLTHVVARASEIGRSIPHTLIDLRMGEDGICDFVDNLGRNTIAWVDEIVPADTPSESRSALLRGLAEPIGVLDELRAVLVVAYHEPRVTDDAVLALSQAAHSSAEIARGIEDRYKIAKAQSARTVDA